MISREERLFRKAEYRKRNLEKINLYARWYNPEIRRRLKREIHGLLGGKCVRCSYQDQRALQIDHVEGGGNIHRRAVKESGPTYYRSILKLIRSGEKKFQLLCANCNWIKRTENNEHN